MDPFTPYTFGSMSLGRNPADIRSDLAVARRAMESGVWFHSSPTYNSGFTYMVLRAAFEEDRSRVPRMILKVRDGSAALMRFEVEDSCRRLGIDSIDVAQLVSMDPSPGNLVDQLRGGGGELADELASLRERGLIRQAVLFLTPENSDAAVEASRNVLIDGVILYWNVTQRDCSTSAWAAIRERDIPVLALRTVGGGPADKATAARDAEVTALLEASGCRSRTELALRQAASEPVVQTTIGGTASLEHLEEFLEASKGATPLSEPILHRIESLQGSL
jgi:aryl-alcohol dehydrogenase-like predicted oxidoreductase